MIAEVAQQVAVPHVEYSAVMPLLIPFGAALVLLLGLALFPKRPPLAVFALTTIAALVGAMISTAVLWMRFQDRGAYTTFSHTMNVDGFGLFVAFVILAAALLVQSIAEPYLRRENLDGPEFSVLLLCATSGAVMMAMANDLILVFLGLEILSISLYVLAGFHRRRRSSGESAIKYFVLGSVASAVLLYGIALVYGATGTTNILDIGAYVEKIPTTNIGGVGPAATQPTGLLVAGMILLFVGLAFKVAAAPFHFWAPDVYQGAPTPVTAYMAAGAKAAAFAAFLRIFLVAFQPISDQWKPIVFVIAVMTLVVGSVLAVVQRDVKRMLAYSSISHAGFMLVGLQANSNRGVQGVLIYLLLYTFMTAGSFGIATIVGRQGDGDHSLAAYRGLASRRPILAFLFTIFLLAQAGVPGTSGFIAKFGVILASAQAKEYALALVAMLAASVAAFFYLRVIIVMFSSPLDEKGEAETADDLDLRAQGRVRYPLSAPIMTTLTIAAVATVVLGVVPALAMNFAQSASLAGF